MKYLRRGSEHGSLAARSPRPCNHRAKSAFSLGLPVSVTVIASTDVASAAEQHTKSMRSVQYQDKAEPYLGTAFIRTSLAVDQVESSRVYSYDWTLKTRQISNLRTTVDVVDRSVELKRAVVFHDDQIEAYMSGTAYTHHNSTKKPFYCAVAPDYIQAGLIPQWESGVWRSTVTY